jgi:hypothetical protein
MRIVSSFLIALFMLSISVPFAQAKVLPQAGKIAPKQSAPKANGTTIGVFPKLRADRKAITVNFTNLQNATSVSYSLVYKQGPSGQQEGARGALNLTGQTTDKVELLFGTCSAGVCRYHTNIKDAKLEVSYTSKTGKKYIKKFKIKI